MRLCLLALAVTACASARPVQSRQPTDTSRGLRASEHLAVADSQQQAAVQSSTLPDMRGDGINTGTQLMQPWYRSSGTGADHADKVQYHRAAASALIGDYTAACGAIPSAQAAVSPIARFGIGGWPTQSGAIVYLSADAGDPDEVMAAMVCHRAWMMLSPANALNGPLDLAGLSFDARGDANGITVSLTIRDLKMVAELQKRVEHDLEQAAQHVGPSAKAGMRKPVPASTQTPTLISPTSPLSPPSPRTPAKR